MNSKLEIPTISKVSDMSENKLKSLVGRKVWRNIKFMGEDIRIKKLSVSEVVTIQNKAKELKEGDEANFEVLKQVLKFAMEGADDLSDEDFEGLPLDELSRVANEILKHSGIEQGKSS